METVEDYIKIQGNIEIRSKDFLFYADRKKMQIGGAFKVNKKAPRML